MVDFFILLTFLFISIEFISFFFSSAIEFFFLRDVYLGLFFTVLFLKIFFFTKKEKFNFNLDLILQYYFFFLKKPNFFLNFIYNVLKQIYLYYVSFKYKFSYDTFKVIFNWVTSNISLIWRPLFKKFSYFGYFRSNSSKWIK